MGKEIARLFVVLGLDNKEFRKGMQRTLDDTKQVSKMVAGIGIALAAAMFTATKMYANAGEQALKLSQKTGLATEFVSKLGYAYSQTGANVQSLGTGMKSLNRLLNDASLGSRQARDAFANWGLSFYNILKMNPEDRFMAVAEAIAGIVDPGLRSAAALELFGQSGTELLPLLEEGTQGLRDMMAEAEKLGIVFDKAGAKRAATFNNELTKMITNAQGLGFSLGSTFLPILQPVVELLGKGAANLADWMKPFTTEVRRTFELPKLQAQMAAEQTKFEMGKPNKYLETYEAFINLAYEGQELTETQKEEVQVARDWITARKEEIKSQEEYAKSQQELSRQLILQARQIQDAINSGRMGYGGGGGGRQPGLQQARYENYLYSMGFRGDLSGFYEEWGRANPGQEWTPPPPENNQDFGPSGTSIPMQTNVRTTIQLDGKTIGEIVSQHMGEAYSQQAHMRG